MRDLPFKDNKIPICEGLEAFTAFIKDYPDFFFCPYIADKDVEAWGKSTSRVYMNQVLPHFLYVPVNISRNDTEELKKFLIHVEELMSVAAVNITQPHKSSPVLREIFFDNANSTQNIDTLIRDNTHKLAPYDLNSISFIEWYQSAVGSFDSKHIVLVGVGGVGEPIAKQIASLHPAELILIDPSDKTALAHLLGSKVSYHNSLSDLVSLPDDLVLINAAGKEGGSDQDLQTLITERHSQKNIFVDIRPQLDIAEVEQALSSGWQAFTGHGMNARNDYELLCGIARYLNVQAPDFATFEQLVMAAS